MNQIKVAFVFAWPDFVNVVHRSCPAAFSGLLTHGEMHRDSNQIIFCRDNTVLR